MLASIAAAGERRESGDPHIQLSGNAKVVLERVDGIPLYSWRAG
jgi:hypothetical protein